MLPTDLWWLDQALPCRTAPDERLSIPESDVHVAFLSKLVLAVVLASSDHVGPAPTA